MLGELQWTLVGVVVLIFVAVLVYNHWQDRRAKKRTDEMFEPPQGGGGNVGGGNVFPGRAPDPIADDGFADEPPWKTPSESVSVPAELSVVDELPWSLTDEVHHTPEVSENEPVAPAETPAEPQTTVASPLNVDIEFIIRLPFTLTADRALADMVDRMQSELNLGPNAVRIVGQFEGGGEWHVVDHYSTAKYSRVEIGILLANRKGPISQDTLQGACLLADRYAESHGGVAEYTDIALASRQAIDLDRFCMEVDKLIDFSVVVPDGFPFSGEVLARLVAEQGMQYQPSGSFVMKDETGETLFVLTNMEPSPFPAKGQGLRTHGVTLTLEVARCKNGLAAFDGMIDLGKYLADKLSARMVDNQGRQISPSRIHQDRVVLSEACRLLNDHGIAPGGEQALRLFS